MAREKQEDSSLIAQEQLNGDGKLTVVGAKVHNLRNVDVSMPRHALVVVTGLSGSGKSSLAFDTIYAEGQRRYMETFSTYARQFIGNLERPEVDQISGLSPVIAIEQKSTSRNPRSTVGTITEVYDFLRLLYARASDAYSVVTGKKMVRYSEKQILSLIVEKFNDQKILVLSPAVKGRKGHYRELFEQIRRQGFLRVRVDGEIREVETGMQLDRYKVHDIEIVIDRVLVQAADTKRLDESLKLALKQGKGLMFIADAEGKNMYPFSKNLMCPESGISYPEPEPNTFSFNSPYGACQKCNGLGTVLETDIKKIFPDDNLSIRKGGIAPVGMYKSNWIFKQLQAIGLKYDFDLDTPIKDIPKDAIDTILYGSDKPYKVKTEYMGVTSVYTLNFEGIVNFIINQEAESDSKNIRKWAEGFMNRVSCPECGGTRLKKESLHFRINEKHIGDLAGMDLISLDQWLSDLDSHIDSRKKKIAEEIIRELRSRLSFLLDVGLDYLTLNRPSASLSGGEAQRIRLATQIGSQLVGVLYILDEPSIGLHQRDNQRLIKALKDLRDLGNSVIVVEHDEEMIRAADYVIDIGPGAGMRGGKIVAFGSPDDIMSNPCSITGHFLSGKKEISVPGKRRKGNGKLLKLLGATGHNLKNVDLELPLGKLICVTGVSGSGKSSLINETLYPILKTYFYRGEKKPLPYKAVDGLKNIDKVIEIDQSPIGRTPRSNPATYTGVFDDIRRLFSELPESKIRGYKPGRFSFNVKGGRCETCKGAGVRTIEMNFLPDVFVKCEDCGGKRYNRETLEIRYKGKSINDILNLTINQSVEFFENIPHILPKLKTLQEVGLGYIHLGQQSTTLSGGEAQRVKLASELSRRNTGKTLYILDEPTTGLHFEDIRVLMEVLERLVDKGNTVVVIEHNMDVIKKADHIIDIGLEGGRRGGEILISGTPELVANSGLGFTSSFLREVLTD